jgi:FMN phosphatase YigB (HAD superfamily)
MPWSAGNRMATSRMPKAVIFDLFGTLVKSYRFGPFDRLIAEALGVCLRDFRRVSAETSDERYRGHYPTVEAMMCGLAQKLGVEPKADAIAKASQIRYDSR